MDEQRVLIFPPSRRDGEATRLVLARAALQCKVCVDASETAAEIERGAAALVLSDAMLGSPHVEAILRVLASQPHWSDLPVVLLCPPNSSSDSVAQAMSAFTNVTVLERPASARTLLSAVQAALRARKRQYETRQQLAALKSAEEGLRAREAQLREADRRKDEFLAMLAHELRNPLAPIRNVGELLGRGAAAAAANGGHAAPADCPPDAHRGRSARRVAHHPGAHRATTRNRRPGFHRGRCLRERAATHESAPARRARQRPRAAGIR